MKIKANQTLDDKNIVEDKTTFFYYAFRNILLVSLPLVLVSTFILSLPHSTATGSGSTSSSDHVYFSLDTSCTMSSELTNPHTVDINGGQYKTNVGTTKLNTYCNDGNGYSIYAIGSSNSTDGNTDLINSENNNYNIKTGIYDSSTATPNTPSSWAMKLEAGTGTGNTLTPPTIVNGYDDYSEIPNIYTQVAKRSSETEMNPNTDVTGSYLTTTYAVYASSTQPAGSYSGNVKYVMMHPNSNTQTINNNLEMAFVLAGKEKAQVDENNSYFAMQDMTSDICNSITSNGEITATQLVDTRDNKVYWVAKLADGHCWMTQNLDFDIAADEQDPTIIKTLTSEDTDLTDHSLTGAYSQDNGYNYDTITNILSWTPIRKTIDFSKTKMSGWTSSGTTISSANKTDDPNTNHSSIGNYYNWSAAIASNNSSSLSGDANNSICPKGWRLPSNSENDFNILNNLYKNDSSVGLIDAPLLFTLSGRIESGNLNNSPTTGYYWSSTVLNNTLAYGLNINNGSIGIGTTWYRDNGFNLRCLAR